MSTTTYEFPYDGAKEMLLVEDVDSKEFLVGLFKAMYDELSIPNLKRNRQLSVCRSEIQLNNHSINRCYMEANKPCNSGFLLPFFPLVDRRSHFL